MVTPNRSDDTVTVLLSSPTGYVRTDFRSNGIQPSNVAIADLDEDGRPDLIVLNEKVEENSKVGNVVTFLNDGTGVFTVAQVHVRGRETPRGLCTGDFDGDGHIDVAVANLDTADILILRGRGDGTWLRDEKSYAVGEKPAAVACVDVDGNDRVDVVFARRAAGTIDWINTGQ
jgi:hypothetical protein